MKALILIIGLILGGTNAAFAGFPCQDSALAQAQKWASANQINSAQLEVTDYDENQRGDTVLTLQMLVPHGERDCLSQLTVTFLDEACQVMELEEDTSRVVCR